MKIALFGLATANHVLNSSQISRKLIGSWSDFLFQNIANVRQKREGDESSRGFRELAGMMLFLQGAASNDEEGLQELEDLYTNYGCYCWINGPDEGVIGGGKPKDMVDHHCKELYRCYKCVLNDYEANYTDVHYNVELNEEDGIRSLDCKVNSKQDAENLCECDKRFAMNIARAKQDCLNAKPESHLFGDHCMDPTFRTVSGGGEFEPNLQCDKQFHGHEKDHCCGIYPNRYPYDINFNECCRSQVMTDSLTQVELFTVVPVGMCEPRGGETVISEKGNPHNYLSV